MKVLSRIKSALFLFILPVIALAAGQPQSGAESALNASQTTDVSSPLVEKVRRATAQFKDINVAIAAGFVQATPCVSGPDFGAMGVHFVLPSRIAGGVLSADQPEALIYEPLSNGSMRLVGVEFIVLASVWTKQHPGTTPPALDGQLLNLIEAPNRYGLPEFYEMHVWAWEHNPVGSFADWNTHVSCTQQPVAD
jgi:hypothetical protein